MRPPLREGKEFAASRRASTGHRTEEGRLRIALRKTQYREETRQVLSAGNGKWADSNLEGYSYLIKTSNFE